MTEADNPLVKLVDEHAAMIAITLRSWTVAGKPAIVTTATIDGMARSLAWQALTVYQYMVDLERGVTDGD